MLLETERLIIRPFNIFDLDDFFEYAKSPDVGPNAGWKPHESKRESLAVLEKFCESPYEFAIYHKNDHKVIGSVGVSPDRFRNYPEAKSIGYCMSKAYWGQGLMTEVVKSVLNYYFTKTNTFIISVNHYDFNSRSRRVIEKCGFICEGTLRFAARTYNGQVFDLVTYSLTRNEFFKTTF